MHKTNEEPQTMNNESFHNIEYHVAKLKTVEQRLLNVLRRHEMKPKK
jgi:hypothetical protein